MFCLSHPDVGSPVCVCVCAWGGLPLGAVTGHWAADTHSMVILTSRLPPSRAVRVMGVTDSGLFSGTSRSAVMAFRYHFPDTWRRRFPFLRAQAEPLQSPLPALQPQALLHPQGWRHEHFPAHHPPQQMPSALARPAGGQPLQAPCSQGLCPRGSSGIDPFCSVHSLRDKGWWLTLKHLPSPRAPSSPPCPI